MTTSSPHAFNASLTIAEHDHSIDIYQKQFNDGKESGFVYWFPHEGLLGVWADDLRFFESKLDDAARQKLLLNCLPTLLEAKWK